MSGPRHTTAPWAKAALPHLRTKDLTEAQAWNVGADGGAGSWSNADMPSPSPPHTPAIGKIKHLSLPNS